ncbi:hypothetical protein DVH05_027239 [Phytophthora capsici]|nr:hypothetical protein DVH05_027239 [Phytophthora capsici]
MESSPCRDNPIAKLYVNTHTERCSMTLAHFAEFRLSCDLNCTVSMRMLMAASNTLKATVPSELTVEGRLVLDSNGSFINCRLVWYRYLLAINSSSAYQEKRARCLWLVATYKSCDVCVRIPNPPQESCPLSALR